MASLTPHHTSVNLAHNSSSYPSRTVYAPSSEVPTIRPPEALSGEVHPEKLGGLDDADVGLPEGGTRAWLSVLGVWLVQFANYGYTNAYGVYNDYYVRIYLNDRPASDSSWIGSVQWSFSLIVGLWTGRIFDQGYFYHLMAFGSFLSVFSLFMLSLSQPHQYYQIFLSQGVGLGLGIGIVYAPSLGLISHYFNRRRPLALTLAVSGTGLGGMIHPILLNALIYSKLGFAGAVRRSSLK